MTPLALEMLVWFYSRSDGCSGFPNVERDPQQEIIRLFYAAGIIDRLDALAKTTEKGRAWMAMLLATPKPLPTWFDPRTGEIIKGDAL